MSATTHGSDRVWTAEAFLAADQHQFGDAWRYERVDGAIVAHAAPSPDHGAIISALTTAIDKRLEAGPGSGCRTESGSGAAPRSQQRPTARSPDAIVPAPCDRIKPARKGRRIRV